MEYFELKRQAMAAWYRCSRTADFPKTSEEITKMPSVWKRISDDVYCKLAFQRVLLKEENNDSANESKFKEAKKIKHKGLNEILLEGKNSNDYSNTNTNQQKQAYISTIQSESNDGYQETYSK